jgi:putative DNA primase/helicase
LSRVNDEAWEKTGMPRLYVRASQPVPIRRNEEDELIIEDMDVDRVTYELTHAADYVDDLGKDDPKLVYPPRAVASYVLSALGWSFPVLKAVTTVPVFRPDGTVVLDEGYDEATSLIYAPEKGFSVSVPEKPKKPDVEAAKKLIAEVMGDFPYVDQASIANTFALAMTPVLRELIDGPVPMACIDKPSPGTGATLLVESLALATSGRDPGALGAYEDNNEMRKAITSALHNPEGWLFLDNVDVEFKGSALARVLTAGVWEDRILGVSKTLRAPVRSVWVATGNNLELSLEIARRSYWIRMDAHLEKPWERKASNFTHPELKAWVRANRARIVEAFLTIGRYWFVRKQPIPNDVPAIGSFEAWSGTMGGVLHTAGVEGFLQNSAQLYEKAISNSSLWAAFLEVWYDTYGDTPVTASKVADNVDGNPRLREALPDEFSLMDEYLSRKLGRAFGKHEGVRYGEAGFYLAKGGSHAGTARWSVRRASDEGAVPSSQKPTL